jgi:hypothetical protein
MEGNKHVLCLELDNGQQILQTCKSEKQEAHDGHLSLT